MALSKLNGVTWTSASKFNGIAKASISKVNGIDTTAINGLLANLIAYYDMSGSSGAGETDLTGSYNLALTGTVNSQTGKSGNARGGFPTQNTNYLSNASGPTFGPGIAVSVSLWGWINAAPSNYETFLSLGGPSHSDVDFNIRVDNANHIQFDLAKNQVAGNSATRGSTFSTGQWYHIGITYDGANNMILYVNAGTGVTATFTQTGVNNGTRIMFGGQMYDGGGNIKVNVAPNLFVDETAIWVGRVLTAGDMATLYNGGAGLFYSSFN